MPTFTAQQLIDRAKAAADMHDEFVTPEQWLAWLRVEVVDLELMVARLGYVLREAAVPIVANGAATYSVPSVLAIVAVYRDENGRLIQLRSADPLTRMRQYSSAPDTGDATEFYAQGNVGDDGITLSLYPRPSSGSYVLWKIEHPEGPDLVTDLVSYPLGWEERIVLRLARRARLKEETDTSAIDKEIAQREILIEEAVWSRLLAQTPTIRNSDRVERGASPFSRWPAVTEWFFP